MSDEDKGGSTEDADKVAQARGWGLVNFDRLKNPPTVVAAAVYVVATVFALAVLVLVAFGLFASFQIAYETATGKFADRIEAAKVFFPILLALVGGPLLIWRVITAHIQAQATRHQAETGREAHYTALFTKAVEQLGATREVKETIEIDDSTSDKKRETITKTEPNLEVRLGAIYALDRVARDSERDHWPIMQVLCAYLRNPQNTGLPKLLPKGAERESRDWSAWFVSIEPPRVDVQAALMVIGGKFKSDSGLRLDLRNANVQQAVLDGGHFERAIFDGAGLDRASFNSAHLDGASFRCAHLAYTSFHETHLDDVSFYRAHLVDAQFTDTHLVGARFDEAQLNGAVFSRVNLTGASFSGANLADAQFGPARLDGAWFRGAHLIRASFYESHLEGASFDEAHLDGARFGQAHLVSASFNKAHLDRAVLFHTDLSKVESLDPAALAHALGDSSTKLPEGMERPKNWPDHELRHIEQVEWVLSTRPAG